jgi:hypothetical protein
MGRLAGIVAMAGMLIAFVIGVGIGREDLQVGINWGIAALVYWMAAMLIARVMRGAHGPGFLRRRRTVTH